MAAPRRRLPSLVARLPFGGPDASVGGVVVAPRGGGRQLGVNDGGTRRRRRQRSETASGQSLAGGRSQERKGQFVTEMTGGQALVQSSEHGV